MMGVVRTDYLVLGARFSFDEFYVGCEHFNAPDGLARDEKYIEPFEDDGYKKHTTMPGGFAVISDGMNGEYVIIGRILAKATPPDGFPLTDCMEGWVAQEADVLALLIGQSFPFLAEFKREVRVWLFSHFH